MRAVSLITDLPEETAEIFIYLFIYVLAMCLELQLTTILIVD